MMGVQDQLQQLVDTAGTAVEIEPIKWRLTTHKGNRRLNGELLQFIVPGVGRRYAVLIRRPSSIAMDVLIRGHGARPHVRRRALPQESLFASREEAIREFAELV